MVFTIGKPHSGAADFAPRLKPECRYSPVMRLLGKFVLPLAIALIATLAATAARAMFSLSVMDTAMAAAAAFCVLMVLAIYAGQSISGHLTRKRLTAFSSYDKDIVRRLDQIERDHPDRQQFDRLDERLDELEDTVLGQLAILSANTGQKTGTASGNLLEAADGNQENNRQTSRDTNRDWAVDFENENVVRLVTGKEDKKAGKRNHQQRQREILDALEDGMLRIKLQPVIDLLTRKVAYVDAVVCLEINGEALATRGLTDFLDSRQKAEIDHFAVFELARVCRMLDEDSESAGIFYRFHCPEYEDSDHWQTLSRKLKGDAKLAGRLIAVIAMDVVLGRSGERLTSFFALAEQGISFALAGVSGTKQTLRQLASQRFSHLLAPADSLLSYLPGSNRRAGDEIVPAATRAGSKLVATGITERHQAAGLLDLDVPFGMGDLISAPRNIRLYARADEATGSTSNHTA